MSHMIVVRNYPCSGLFRFQGSVRIVDSYIGENKYSYSYSQSQLYSYSSDSDGREVDISIFNTRECIEGSKVFSRESVRSGRKIAALLVLLGIVSE